MPPEDASAPTIPQPPSQGQGAGSLGRVLAVAVPMVLANLTLPLMALTGTLIAGHLPDAVQFAGVTLGVSFVTMAYMVFTFLRMSATGVVAQASGARDMELVRDTFLSLAALALLGGVLMLALADLWVPLLLPLFGGGPDVQAEAAQYIRIRLLAAPAALLGVVAGGYLLGRRRAVAALLLQASTNLVNIGFAFFLVYSLEFGAAGIAWAAVVADTAGAALALALILPPGFPGAPALRLARLLDRSRIMRLGSLGRDLLIRSLLLLVAQFLFTRSSAQQGAVILAANAILLNLHTLMGYAIDGFAHAIQTLVGSAVGARDVATLRASIRSTLVLTIGVALLFIVVFTLWGSGIVHLVTDHQPVREAAIRHLPWLVLLCLVTLWSYMLDGIFIGATRTRQARDTTVVAVAIFAAALFPARQAFGNDGLWGAFCLFLVARALLLGSIWSRLSWQERITPGT